jgi:hypothetical protein
MQRDLLTAALHNVSVGVETHRPINHLAEQRLGSPRSNGDRVRSGLRVVVAR